MKKLRSLHPLSRRRLLRSLGVAAAAVGVERSGLLQLVADEGGSALADQLTSRALKLVHINGGNGLSPWFHLMWPHVDVALDPDPRFSTFEPASAGVLHAPGGADHSFFYTTKSPWMANGVPSRPVTGIMAGRDETFTNHPTAGMSLGGRRLQEAVRLEQRGLPMLAPAVVVGPAGVSGPRSWAHAADADGLIAHYGRLASDVLAPPEDAALAEAMFAELVALRPAASRSTWKPHVAEAQQVIAAASSGLQAQLVPTAAELAMYGIDGLDGLALTVAQRVGLERFGRLMIVGAKALTLGLSGSLELSMAVTAGVTADDWTTPYFAVNNATQLERTVNVLDVLRSILEGFYAQLADADDPHLPGSRLDERVVLHIYGDTPFRPIENQFWTDATPGSSNWIYLVGQGHVRSGWFGGLTPSGGGGVTHRGFDPVTGADVPGQSSALTTGAANAATLHAVTEGDSYRVNEHYRGEPYDGLV